MKRLMKVFDVVDKQTQSDSGSDILEERLFTRPAFQDENASGNGVDHIDVGCPDGIVPVAWFLERNIRIMEDGMVGIGRFKLEHFRSLIRPAFDLISPDGCGGKSFIAEQCVNMGGGGRPGD